MVVSGCTGRGDVYVPPRVCRVVLYDSKANQVRRSITRFKDTAYSGAFPPTVYVHAALRAARELTSARHVAFAPVQPRTAATAA